MFSRRILMLVGGVWLAACFCVPAAVPVESTDSNVLLLESFADQEAALKRWNFSPGGRAKLTIIETDEIAKKPAVYVDFRERASWQLLCSQPIQLKAGGQYTLSARVRRNLGYGAMRLIAQTCDQPKPTILTEARVIKRHNQRHQISVIFTVKADTAVRVGFAAAGYAEIWIDQIKLQRNVPPVSSYRTGILLPPRSPVGQARYRTGAFFEAEDIVATADVVTDDDADDDHRWARCRLDPAHNPWLFSDHTVVKSDSRSTEEGGRMPPLRLSTANLLPGPYQVFLSDPYRAAGVSLDGNNWRRVPGSAGEIDLGLIDIDGTFSIWVAHRYRTADNPGPIYVDYLRFMPVYDAKRGLEQPAAPPPVPEPPAIQQTALRLCNAGGVPRRQEWVRAGIPFARGAFRPGDGICIAGVSNLITRPLVLWPDGSVKWLRVEFRTDTAGAGEAARVVRYGRGVDKIEQAAGAVSVTGARRSLKCGPVEIVVNSGIWDKVLLGGEEIISRPPSVRMKTASAVRLDQLIVESVQTENEGPHPTIFVRGHLGTAGRPGPAAFKARLFETAPGTIGLHFSVINESDERYLPGAGCSPAVALTELTLVLDGIRIAPKSVSWPSGLVPLDGQAQTLLQTGTGPCVEEFLGSCKLTKGSKVISSGQRTEGWVDLRQPGRGLAVGVREFFQKCPKSISVKKSADGASVAIGIWPAGKGRVMRYAQGTQLTTEIALVLHDGTQADGQRASRMASVLEPLRAVLPQQYYCQTDIFGPITTEREDRFAGYYASAEETFKTLTSKHMNYGIENWGDFFSSCGYVRSTNKLWINMEWGFVQYLVTEFIRTGDDAYLQYARRAARHFANIDIIHYSSRRNWTGASYVHTGDMREGHQVDTPNFAHAGWPRGLLWAYYLGGDELLREAAVGLADYVVNNMPPEGIYRSQPPFAMWNLMRQSGNPMLTLGCLYELTGDPKYLPALNRIVDYALRVQDPKLGCWSVPFYEDPVYHRPSPHGGPMLLRGLLLYWQLTGDRRVPRAFNRLESFLLEKHPPETRRHLRPGSSYRTSFGQVAEHMALASLFSDDPDTLLKTGAELLVKQFPKGSAKPIGTRGIPGALLGGARLTGAISRAKEKHAADAGQD